MFVVIFSHTAIILFLLCFLCFLAAVGCFLYVCGGFVTLLAVKLVLWFFKMFVIIDILCISPWYSVFIYFHLTST